MTAGEPTARIELEAAHARVLAGPDLSPEALTGRLNEAVAVHLEGVPADLLTRLLTTMEEQSKQSVALDDPGSRWFAFTIDVRPILSTPKARGGDAGVFFGWSRSARAACSPACRATWRPSRCTAWRRSPPAATPQPWPWPKILSASGKGSK